MVREWDSDELFLEFTQMLPRLRSELGPFHLAICTGDVADKGHETEFTKMQQWFSKWLLSDSGLALGKDQVLVVPGNHDVNRGNISHSAQVLHNSIHEKNSHDEIAKHITTEDSHRLLVARLKDYRKFAGFVSSVATELDGSWQHHINTGRYRLEIEGLSSSWLSFNSKEDGWLVVGKCQLQKFRSNRVQNAFRLAVIHHPLASLLECDRTSLEQEFRNHYDIVLRGHLHAATAKHVHEHGKQYREIATGALYAGSEYRNGFNVLEFDFETRKLSISAFTWFDGKWERDRMTYPPNGIEQVDLQFSLATPAQPVVSKDLPNAPAPEEHGEIREISLPRETNNVLLALLTNGKSETTRDSSDASRTKSNTAFISRPPIPSEANLSAWHHLADAIAAEIRAGRSCCVFVPPGFDSADVIPVLCHRCDEHVQEHLYLSNAHGARTFEELGRSLEATLGASLPDFMLACEQNEGGLLVVEDFSSGTAINDSHHSDSTAPTRLIQLLKEYCPELAIVAFSSDPTTPFTHQMEPLDALAVREFVRSADSEFLPFSDFAQVETLADVSGGIPQNLKKFVALRAVSDFETAIADLRRPDDTSSEDMLTLNQRGLLDTRIEDRPRLRNLIDVLAILERGEPLREIRRIVGGNYPPNSADAVELVQSQVATTTKIDSFQQSGSNDASILALRKQARDYVHQRLTPERRASVLNLVAQAYFGTDWARDSLRLRANGGRKSSSFKDGSRLFANEVYVIEELFETCRSDIEQLVKVASLALKYCEALRRQDRFGDAFFASRELLPRVESACELTGQTDVEIEFRISTARSSRMTGEAELAIRLLEGVEKEPPATEFKDRRLDALTALMLSYESEERPADVLRVARLLTKEAPKNSWYELQAQALIAAAEGDDESVSKRLLSLERRARSKKHLVVAENILLQLAYRASSPTQARAYLQRVRAGDERMYNFLRATARYATLTVRHNGVEALTTSDIQAIEAGYSFMFSQRMSSLLTEFHDVMWKILEFRGEHDKQLQLLKHSSFVWRLCGEEDRDKMYLREVKTRVENTSRTLSGMLSRAVSYIVIRLRSI